MVILQISENAQEFLGVAAEALLQASDHAMAVKEAEVS